MKVTQTALPGVLLLSPQVFDDTRGFFLERFNQAVFSKATGTHEVFVQDNLSRSRKGVLRGLHYQLPPNAQGKLLSVVRGAVWDVVVDMRAGSPTFGQWVAETLTEDNYKQLWIPQGFAHGFVALSDTADVLYKTTNYYAPQSDRGIAWNDPDIDIHWPDLGMDFLLSEKDQNQPAFKQADVFTG